MKSCIPYSRGASGITHDVIGAAIGVHKDKGPGLLECLFVEVKAVEKVHPIHQAQLLSYMKLLDMPLGLLINFHELKLTDGVSRVILLGANRTGN